MKRLQWVLFACLLTSLSAQAGQKQRPVKCPSKPGKVIICHSPPGNPANKKILAVDQTSVSDHTAHGDRVGICEGTEYQEMKELCGICDSDMDTGC